MDRLSELGTARGFARQAVERAERELERAKAEYEVRDLAYQRYVAASKPCELGCWEDCPRDCPCDCHRPLDDPYRITAFRDRQ